MARELLTAAGGVLILVLAGAWAWGFARYLRHDFEIDQCPRCGEQRWHRIHRTLNDHLIGWGLNLRRYRCENPQCRWQGLRMRHN